MRSTPPFRVDITTESPPIPVSTFQVPVAVPPGKVEVDERNRANTGLHIVEPRGPARGGA